MLPPSEIRRRGNRRRAGRYLGTAAGVAALAIIAGVAVWQSPLLDDRSGPDWAGPSPSPTASPTATPTPPPTPTTVPPTPSTPGSPVAPEVPSVTPPGWANVPTADLLLDPQVTGEVKAEHEPPPGVAIGLCDPGDYGSPSTFLVRELGLAGDAYPTDVWAVVLGYPSVDAATAGFDTINDAAINCAGQLEDAGLTDARIQDHSDDVVLNPDIVDAEPVRVGYSFGFGLIPEDAYDTGRWTESTVLQAGERVMWITTTFDGQDFNCSVAPDPDAQQCLRPAAVPSLLTLLVE